MQYSPTPAVKGVDLKIPLLFPYVSSAVKVISVTAEPSFSRLEHGSHFRLRVRSDKVDAIRTVRHYWDVNWALEELVRERTGALAAGPREFCF